MTYYNTTNESGSQLDLYTQSAKTQDERVMALYYTFIEAGPSQIWKAYNRVYKDVPLTSIRRSITNLKNEGKLIETEHKALGSYGRPEYVLKLNK